MHSPQADYALQGGERQTKRSQESIYVYFYTDSSSVFRFPQNDNAAFALNHFGSETHSSVRPGRLRGAHLRCEPAPGTRSKTLKCPLHIVCKLRGRLVLSTGGNASRKYELLSGRLVKLESQIPALAVRAEAPPRGGSQNSPPLASARGHLLYLYRNRAVAN